MDVSVRELRNETARVMAAVEAGTPVTLTVHGRPVADILPRRERRERRPSAVVYQEIEELAELARELGVSGETDVSDYDSGLTSDDFLMAGGLLLDTSVFIAAETGRPLRSRPEGEARVSVATLAELRLGVLRAEGRVQQVREATLAAARRFVPMAVDEHVADELAALLAKLRASQRRAKAFDCFIAATALAHDLTVVAQDADFEELEAADSRLMVAIV